MSSNKTFASRYADTDFLYSVQTVKEKNQNFFDKQRSKAAMIMACQIFLSDIFAKLIGKRSFEDILHVVPVALISLQRTPTWYLLTQLGSKNPFGTAESHCKIKHSTIFHFQDTTNYSFGLERPSMKE